MMEFISNSPEETLKFGREVGRLLSLGDVVGLFGSLATGKTVLTKGILKGIGMKDVKYVNSPSFTLMHQYNIKKRTVYHFDLYRVSNIKEIEELGWDEFLNSDNICIIEWAQKAESIMSEEYLKVELYIENRSSRRLCVIPKGGKYTGIVEKLNEKVFSNQTPEGGREAKPESRNQKK